MLELKEKILSDGEIIEPDILKVDSFINHQIDPKTYRSIAKEIFLLFLLKKEHLKQLMMIYIQVKYIHILKEQDILLALKRNI